MPEQKTTRAPYVIVSPFDAPQPDMVCQWVRGVGYCYLDRRGTKPDFDGMRGAEATSIDAFGFAWTDNPDGTVSFYRSERPATAVYPDGQPRSWQHRSHSFEWRRLTAGVVAAKRERANA